MRRIPVLLLLLAFLPAFAREPLSHTDYIECTANMERLSIKALLDKPFEKELGGAMRCKPSNDETGATMGLTLDQIIQFRKILSLTTSQISAPTETVHIRLRKEIAKFVGMLD